jgi:hypothetical protein
LELHKFDLCPFSVEVWRYVGTYLRERTAVPVCIPLA